MTMTTIRRRESKKRRTDSFGSGELLIETRASKAWWLMESATSLRRESLESADAGKGSERDGSTGKGSTG